MSPVSHIHICVAHNVLAKSPKYARMSSISLHGTLYMGPTMYLWVRFATAMFPGRALSSSLAKAACEQLAYDPLAIVVFMFVMTLAEGKTMQDAKNEVLRQNIRRKKVRF